VERRAREILDEVKWGIYPDTPKSVLAQIDRYRAGDNETKISVCRDLIALGHPGYAALLKIAAAEESATMRQTLYQEMAREVVRAAGGFLLEGNQQILEDLLEQSLVGEREGSYRNYAAHLLFRGRLDGKIAEFQTKALKGNGDRQAAEILFYLGRAKGDVALLRRAAEKAGKPRLLNFALAETGAWKELAERYEKDHDPHEFGIERLTLAIAYQRLAGNAAKLDEALAQLDKFVKDNFDDTGYVWLGAKALYLNDRPAEGLAALLRGKQIQSAFDVLCTQYKFAEALQLTENLADLPEDQRFAVQMSLGRFLTYLGDRDKAQAVLAKLGEQIGDRSRYPSGQDLVQLLMRLDLKEQAANYAAGLLRKEEKREYREPLLEALFPNHATTAPVWWTIYRRQFSADEAAAILLHMRHLFEGKITGKAFDELRQKAEDQVGDFQENPALFWQAIAEAAAAAGRPELEEKYLVRAAEKATQPGPLLRLGDILAGRKAWKEAAQRYRQAWDKDRSQPLPLFLQGKALVQAGQQQEGAKLQEFAHWLPLGSERVRYQFAKALEERGYSDDAQRERDLVLRVGILEDWAVNETLRHLAYAAMHKKDFQRAADLFEKFRLRCMRTDVYFIEFSAHVQVPALVHQCRARAYLHEGKIDEAKKEVQLCLTLTPGNVNLPIRLVGDLERAGRKQEADELFQQVFAIHDKLCKDHPSSSSSLNTLAWLCACCRRQLDRGLEVAETAVRLAPQAAYLDTLAEVYFQRGNQAKALELTKRCLELEPKNAYFQRQLKRIAAGDPKVDVPEEGE